MQGLFFTGTDTGVGKTYVAAAVARLLRRQGREVRVCKPIATGATWDGTRYVGADTRHLSAAAGNDDLGRITPWAFREPAAPPVAARLHGVTLNLGEIIESTRRCYVAGSVLVVEGIGGLLCPLTDDATVADLVRALGLPLVVVTRRSLGTLNHTLLTLEVARSRGLNVAGVVVNETTVPGGIAEVENVKELVRLGVPVLAVMPYTGGPSALVDVDWWQLATTGSEGI